MRSSGVMFFITESTQRVSSIKKYGVLSAGITFVPIFLGEGPVCQWILALIKIIERINALTNTTLFKSYVLYAYARTIQIPRLFQFLLGLQSL